MRTSHSIRALIPRTFFGMAMAGCAVAGVFAPQPALACACGCGIFDVGAETLPTEMGLLVWFRYSYMNQNQNWEHGGKALRSDNTDKKLSTSFYTPGAAYAVNDDWMVMAELPIYARQFTSTDDGTKAGPPGSIFTAHDTTLGD